MRRRRIAVVKLAAGFPLMRTRRRTRQVHGSAIDGTPSTGGGYRGDQVDCGRLGGPRAGGRHPCHLAATRGFDSCFRSAGGWRICTNSVHFSFRVGWCRVVTLQRGDDDAPLRQMLIARQSLEQLVDTRGDPQRQPTVIRRALAGPKAGGGPAALPLLRGRHRRMLTRRV